MMELPKGGVMFAEAAPALNNGFSWAAANAVLPNEISRKTLIRKKRNICISPYCWSLETGAFSMLPYQLHRRGIYWDIADSLSKN